MLQSHPPRNPDRAPSRRRREDELKTEAGGRGSSASNKRKVAANVRSYLAHFCVICSESASEHTHKPNLRMLDAITRTLEAVYRRMGINMESVESMSAGPLGPGEALVPSSTPGFLRTLPYLLLSPAPSLPHHRLRYVTVVSMMAASPLLHPTPSQEGHLGWLVWFLFGVS